MKEAPSTIFSSQVTMQSSPFPRALPFPPTLPSVWSVRVSMSSAHPHFSRFSPHMPHCSHTGDHTSSLISSSSYCPSAPKGPSLEGSLPHTCLPGVAYPPGAHAHPHGTSQASRSALRWDPRGPELLLVSTAYGAWCLRHGADQKKAGQTISPARDTSGPQGMAHIETLAR